MKNFDYIYHLKIECLLCITLILDTKRNTKIINKNTYPEEIVSLEENMRQLYKQL